jgi:hypothetical protein
LGFVGKTGEDILYDPWPVKDKKARDYRKQKNQSSSIDDSPETSQNGHSSRENGNDNRPKTHRGQSDTVQYKDSSRLKGDYWTNKHPDPAHERAGSDATNPSSLAWAANDSELSADLDKLSAEYTMLDVRAEFQKWVARCEKDGHAKTREWFLGFLALAAKHAEKQRSAKPATAPPKRKRTAEPMDAETIAQQYADALRNMRPIEGASDDKLDRRVEAFVRGHIPDKYGKYVDEVVSCAYENHLFDCYTVDRLESRDSGSCSTIGVAGANNIRVDERGIYRRHDSKWLVAGAYGPATPPAAALPS